MFRFDPQDWPGEVRLAHGSGGQGTQDLISRLFAAAFSDAALSELTDAAVLDNPGGRLAFCTDSHAVHPLFFPGGDIGRLAVSGTVNDLAVMGARPAFLSSAFLLEEGLPLATLARVVASMAATAAGAGVRVVTGDTKVLERGRGHGLFVNTSGVGFVPSGLRLGAARVRPGDVLIVNGTLGDHGFTVLTAREGLADGLGLRSDVAPLNGLIAALRSAVPGVRFMRDLTRGGLAAVANELAGGQPWGLRVFEANVPVSGAVRAAAQVLGIDPLVAANEGKALFVVRPQD
ncbi:MAG TPA: hydrogenase expression/formation protein HypE, partial [Deinococcales bacterium]|nr:hydrogenase expression/formation protein HypE [Deinococcales bacterium]